MILDFAPLPLLGSLQSALDQPLFPGKLVIWMLLMLSIVSWVLIVSKTLHLAKTKRVDRAFTERLRKSKTTLEVFEEGWEEEKSLQYPIYLAGAREAAFQLLGSREPSESMQRQIREVPSLSPQEVSFLHLAFRSGFNSARTKLHSGVAGLRFIGFASLLLGLIGGLWTLMSGFDTAANFKEIAPFVGAALGFVVISLLVATPAMLGRLGLHNHIRRRESELGKFRDDIARLFERSYAAKPAKGERARATTKPRRENDLEKRDATMTAHEDSKKKYHSIRDQLLSGPDENDGINPIARQAATLRPL